MNRDGSVPRDLTLRRRQLSVAHAVVVAAHHTTSRVIDRPVLERFLNELESLRASRYMRDLKQVRSTDRRSKKNFADGHREAYLAYSNLDEIWRIIAHICSYASDVPRILVPERLKLPANTHLYRERCQEPIEQLAYKYFD